MIFNVLRKEICMDKDTKKKTTSKTSSKTSTTKKSTG